MSVPSPNYRDRDVDPERMAAVNLHAGNRVLDVGCGSGRYVRAITGSRSVMGVDIARYEEWHDQACYVQAPGYPLPFADNSFDTTLCFDALEHMPDPMAALREFYRVSARNVIITVPNCDVTEGMETSRLTYFHYIDPTHCNFYSLEGLAGAVGDAGFQVTHKQYINSLSLLPLLNEACNLRGLPGLLVRQMFKRLIRRSYMLTCLIVAQKPNTTHDGERMGL